MTVKEYFEIKISEVFPTHGMDENTISVFYNRLPKEYYPRTEMVEWILTECQKEFGDTCFCRDSLIAWLRGERIPSNPLHAAYITKLTGLKWE